MEIGQRKLGGEVVELDCQIRELRKEDAVDRRKRRNITKTVYE